MDNYLRDPAYLLDLAARRHLRCAKGDDRRKLRERIQECIDRLDVLGIEVRSRKRTKSNR